MDRAFENHGHVLRLRELPELPSPRDLFATEETMRVNLSDFSAIVAERNRLREQVTELQTRNTELVEDSRKAASPFEALNSLAADVHELAKEKGWYDGGPRPIPELLVLIHSEVTEALEAYRVSKEGDDLAVLQFGESGKPEGFASEAADVVIRTLDMCEALGIDIGEAVRVKHLWNTRRPFRHGGKRA